MPKTAYHITIHSQYHSKLLDHPLICPCFLKPRVIIPNTAFVSFTFTYCSLSYFGDLESPTWFLFLLQNSATFNMFFVFFFFFPVWNVQVNACFTDSIMQKSWKIKCITRDVLENSCVLNPEQYATLRKLTVDSAVDFLVADCLKMPLKHGGSCSIIKC